MIKVGCCGFPGGMKPYFKEFEVVEVQKTFYKLPRIETAAKWRDQAPANFEFTLKASQLITHEPTSPTYRKAGIKLSLEDKDKYGSFKPTENVLLAWDETKKISKALEAKIVIFQCPVSFKPTKENLKNLRDFFQTIDREGLLCAWEPRGEWRDDEIASLCKELDLIHCVDPFLREPLGGGIRYYRLHGGPGYRHKYTDDELEELRKKCWGETYCMFNNIAMHEDALRFKEMIQR